MKSRFTTKFIYIFSILVILLLSINNVFATPNSITNDFIRLSDFQNSGIDLYVYGKNLEQDLNKGDFDLKLFFDGRLLLRGKQYPQNIKLEIYTIVEGKKSFVSILNRTVKSNTAAENILLTTKLPRVIESTELHFDLYNANNVLEATYNTNITVNTSVITETESIGDYDCQDGDGECLIEYILRNLSFSAGYDRNLKTEVVKNTKGRYTVSIPIKKGSTLKSKVRKIGSSGGGKTNGIGATKLEDPYPYFQNDVEVASTYWDEVREALKIKFVNSDKEFNFKKDGSLQLSTNLDKGFLNIAAGTENKAPIVFSQGQLLTDLVEGALEYDGQDLYFTNGTERKIISQGGPQGPAGAPGPIGPAGPPGSGSVIDLSNGGFLNGNISFTGSSFIEDAVFNGSFQYKTGAQNGYVLSSDVNGKATWQNISSLVNGSGASASGVAGAIQFSDGSNGFNSDANNFFWDNTNKRIGIGTNTPNYGFEFQSNGNAFAEPQFAITNKATTDSFETWRFSVGTPGSYDGYLKILGGNSINQNDWTLALVYDVAPANRRVTTPGAFVAPAYNTSITGLGDWPIMSWSQAASFNGTVSIGNHHPWGNHGVDALLSAPSGSAGNIAGTKFRVFDSTNVIELFSVTNQGATAINSQTQSLVTFTVKASNGQTANLSEWKNFNNNTLFSIANSGQLTIRDGTQANGFVLTSDINGNASWQDPASLLGSGASASGVAGAIQFSDGSNGFSSNASSFYWDNNNGNLGIGTNSPQYSVHTQGVIRAQDGSDYISLDPIATNPSISLFRSGGWHTRLEANGSGLKIYGGGSGIDALATFSPTVYEFYKQSYRLGLTSHTTPVVYDAYMFGTPSAEAYKIRTFNAAGSMLDRFAITGRDNLAKAYFLNSNLGVGTSNPNAKLAIDIDSNTEQGLILKSASMQTANLTEWQNFNGTQLLRVANDGGIQWSNTPDKLISTTGGSLSWISPFASTVNFSSAQVGQSSTLNLVTNENKLAGLAHYDVANAKGRLLDLFSNPAVDISISPSGTELIRFSAFGTADITSTANWDITSAYNGKVATIIRGANGQTANLSEWKDFSNNTVFSIANSGQLTIRDGTQANGYVLTSDANGLASWQDPATLISSGASASGIAGAIQFSDGSNGLTSNATNLFWDNSTSQFDVTGGVEITHPSNASWNVVLGADYAQRLTIDGSIKFTAGNIIYNSVSDAIYHSLSTYFQEFSTLAEANPIVEQNKFNYITLGDWVPSVPNQAINIIHSEETINSTANGTLVGLDTTLIDNSLSRENNVIGIKADVSGGTNISANRYAAILVGGKVGIETLSPRATLHVNGNLMFTDGTQANGYVLTSDANGLASWQDPASLLGSGASASGIAGAIQFSDGSNGFNSNATSFFWNNLSGSLGIGTNVPNAPLTISKPTTITNQKFFTVTANGNEIASLQEGILPNYGGTLALKDAAGAGNFVRMRYDAGYPKVDTNRDNLSLGTSGGLRLVFASTYTSFSGFGDITFYNTGSTRGNLKAGSLELEATNSSRLPLIVQGATLQAEDLTQWQDRNGTQLLAIGKTGRIHGNASGRIDFVNSMNENAGILIEPIAADGRIRMRHTANPTSSIEFWHGGSGVLIPSGIFGSTAGTITNNVKWGTGWAGNSNNLRLDSSSPSGADAILSLRAERYADVSANGQPSLEIAAKSINFKMSNRSTHIGTGTTIAAITENGKFAITDGTQTNGYVFTSNINGEGSWKDPASLLGSGASGIAGAIQFSDGSNGFNSNASSFFWDNTNGALTASQVLLTSDGNGARIRPSSGPGSLTLSAFSTPNSIMISQLANSGVGIRNGGAIFNPTATLDVRNFSTTIPAGIFRAAVSQTANLSEWQNGGGAVLSYLNNNGQLRFSNQGTYDHLVRFGSGYLRNDGVVVGSTLAIETGEQPTINSSEFRVGDTYRLGWTPSTGISGVLDTYFTRESAAIIQVGNDSIAAVSYTFKPGDGLGTDMAGASLSFAAGRSTGSAAGGDLIFQTANGSTSGASQNILDERMRITDTGEIGIGESNPQRALHIKDVMRLEPRAAAPAAPATGDIYIDSDGSQAACVYLNGAWVVMAGAGSCS